MAGPRRILVRHFLWILLSIAVGVNNHGRIAGKDRLSYCVTYACFSTTLLTGTSIDLNDTTIGCLPAGFDLQQGRGIDDCRYYRAGVNSAGVSDAFLLTPATPGDANLDGKVDINEILTIVLAHYGQTGMTLSKRVYRERHGGHQRPDHRVGKL